ncbi:hypothetical protein L0936_17215 [Paracidovorax citrulli]|uniref:hypothetical protein n=1 Tax=Paracidovorax citrulli TaxID=80869 RepID=UPI000308BAB1|nr:hypothetical protein [Paracidovorax citrulli]UEG47436.1 hypothetical protein LKW27_06090 [Paracidovorax citrulli]UMT95980.1 hypothetical protein FRC97_13745 [Paracidovorax citrulli]
MQFTSNVTVHGIKESKGTFEGKPFSSTTFHCEVDLKENGAGRSLGRVTRPFKIGDAGEFDKWAHLGNAFPIQAEAVFEMEAARDDGSRLVLVSIKPLKRVAAPA